MKYNFPLTCMIVLLPFWLLCACAKHQPEEAQVIPPPPITLGDITPEKISPGAMQQGLAVTYYLKFYKRDLEYLKQMEEDEFETFTGEPIVQLNHQFGDGEVFGSGTSRGVALRMNGYLLFPEPGSYELQALSNDGVIVILADKLAISDPRQHSDQLSNIARIKIGTAGWIPISVDYFQRKGTSALKLFWKMPEKEGFEPVPQTSYGHLPQ